MTKKLLTGSALAVLLAAGACTVHQTEVPSLSGPSTFARSVSLTAIPDRLTQDGASQSAVSALVIGPDGRPLAGVSLRMDMLVAGQTNDYGTLSARTVVTGSDGMARVVYTAPPAPPPPADTSVSTVSIRAITIGADAQADSAASADIRLVPAGIILPPAGTPTAAFTMSPAQALMNVPVTFDASRSTPGEGASSISSYSWNFGDGTAAGTGRSVTHTFTTQQTFNVTLTVTNDRGLSASTTTPTAVGALAAPVARFVYSPSAPAVGQAVLFDADQTTAAPGHTITAVNWSFGDGGTASGNYASHTYTAAGSFNVVLSVTDDTGQKGTVSQAVTITASSGGGGGATVASFVVSPTAPVVGQVVFFNGSGSTAATGRTLTRYAWDFGDGTVFSDTSASTSHTFTTASTFTVQLIVTDSTGQTAKFTSGVTVAAAGAVVPTASFTFSPAAPVTNQAVFFNASASTAGAGHTLVSYAWDFGDSLVPGAGVTTSHAYTAAGTYTVTLTVTDETGQVGVTSKAVAIVSTSVTPPTAAFTLSPSPAVAGVQVVADASTSTAAFSLSLVSYQWNFGDSTPILTCHAPLAAGDAAQCGATGRTVSHVWVTTGTFSVSLVVTDSTGQQASTSKSLIVNVVGSLAAGFTFTPPNPAPGALVTFDASGSTVQASIVRYQWSWGDGTAPTVLAANSTTHTFVAAGTYTVTLTVFDAAGNSNTIALAVVVQ